jgi:molybdopterin converting factor small subunit
VSDHGTIAGVATVLLGGSGGYVASELIRSLAARRQRRLDETKAPSEIEATISAGARDAVSALRETLGELRSELADLRERCETGERELEEERKLRRTLERKVALLEQRLARRN